MHIGEGARSEKTREEPEFIPQSDPWHKDSLQTIKKKKTINNKQNNNKKQQALRKEENLIFRVTTLLDQMSSF